MSGQSLSVYASDFLDASAKSGDTLWEPALTAGWSNYVSKPAGFGTGGDGYGYHFGVALADNVNGKFMRKFVFAAAAGQRDIYTPPDNGGFWNRVGNAMGHSLYVPTSQSSSKTFNWSGIPASAASAALSNAYQPAQQRTWSATFVRIGTNSAGYMVGDVWAVVTAWTKEHPVWHVLLKSQ
jgi:hypothetical protein